MSADIQERDEQITFSDEKPYDVAFDQLDLLCREYQGLRRKLWDAVRTDGTDSVAAERLRMAVLLAGRKIRETQEDWYMRGAAVFVSYDSNGQPIRASKNRKFVIG